MNIKIRIDCDNAAFYGEDAHGNEVHEPEAEVGRILENLGATLVRSVGAPFSPGREIALSDANGNTVGMLTVEG